MRKVSVLCVAIIATILSSCQQEEITSRANSIEAAACDIGFTRVDDISILGTRTIEASKLVTTQQTSGLGIKARIARKKTGCKSGFGLCDFRALQSQDNILRLQTRTQNFIRDNHECFTQCVIDSTGNGVAFFLLAKSPESKGLTSEMMPLFYVDEDIEQPIEETPDYSLFAVQGAYPYQKSLGKFGGYAVKMKYHKQ